MFNFIIKTIAEEYYFVGGGGLLLTQRHLAVYNRLGDLEYQFLLADIESVHPTTLSLKEWMQLGIA